MPFDFKPVKAFLAAEIATLKGFEGKLQQVLDFLPDDSSQLSPSMPIEAPPAPPVSSSAPVGSEPPSSGSLPPSEPPSYLIAS